MKHPYTIFDEMRRVQNQMDRAFGNFFSPVPFDNEYLLEVHPNETNKSSNYSAPTSDLYESDKEVIAEIDMPGVDKKDIKVNVNQDSIEIKAEKKSQTKEEDKMKGMFRLERSYSGFYRKLPLPRKVDSEKAHAEYKDGVLKIKIPKLQIEQKKQKLLEIQ